VRDTYRSDMPSFTYTPITLTFTWLFLAFASLASVDAIARPQFLTDVVATCANKIASCQSCHASATPNENNASLPAAAAYLGGGAAAACATLPDQPPAPLAGTPPSAANGQTLWANCAGCHNGTTALAPSAWAVHPITAASISAGVTTSAGAALMKSFASWTPAQFADLACYLDATQCSSPSTGGATPTPPVTVPAISPPRSQTSEDSGESERHNESETVSACRGDKPTLDAVPAEWDVHARQELSFSVTAYDCHGRSLTIAAAKLPKGASFAQAYDGSLGKQRGTIRWTPGVDNAGKRLLWSFTAVASDSSGKKRSSPQKTRIVVLDAINDGSPDPAADAAVARISVSRATWRTGQGRLVITGQISWRSGASKGLRAEAVATGAVKILNAQTAVELGETSANRNGRWTAMVPLTSDAALPALAEVTFHGKTSLPKRVKFGP